MFCTINLAISRICGLGRKWGKVIQILNNTAAKRISISGKSVSRDGKRHLENKSQICIQINGISYIPSGEIMSKKMKLHKMLNNPIADLNIDK
jgi:hypothetical protein